MVVELDWCGELEVVVRVAQADGDILARIHEVAQLDPKLALLLEKDAAPGLVQL